MADHHRRADKALVQRVLLEDPEFLRRIVERALQQVLEAEITEHIGAAPTSAPNAAKGTGLLLSVRLDFGTNPEEPSSSVNQRYSRR